MIVYVQLASRKMRAAEDNSEGYMYGTSCIQVMSVMSVDQWIPYWWAYCRQCRTPSLCQPMHLREHASCQACWDRIYSETGPGTGRSLTEFYTLDHRLYPMDFHQAGMSTAYILDGPEGALAYLHGYLAERYPQRDTSGPSDAHLQEAESKAP